MRRTLTSDECDRQLPLLPVPLYSVEPRQLQVDPPVPGSMRVQCDGCGSGFSYATCDVHEGERGPAAWGRLRGCRACCAPPSREESPWLRHGIILTGALFPVVAPKTTKHPQFTGFGTIDGRLYWIAGWTRTVQRGAHAGEKYISLAFTPPQNAGAPQARPAGPDPDADLPY